jgi:hypothetical protein
LADDQAADLIDRHALHLHANRSVRALCARPRMGRKDLLAFLQHTLHGNVCRTGTLSTERRMSPREMPPHACEAEPSTMSFTTHGARFPAHQCRRSSVPHILRSPVFAGNMACAGSGALMSSCAREQRPLGPSSTSPTPARSSS